MNSLYKKLCLGFGVISLIGTTVPVHAIDSNKTTKLEVQTHDQEPIMNDVVILGAPQPIPTDGDAMNLNVGWANIGGTYYYCKDESRVKVAGWQQINGKWYYFDPTSYKMKEGWLYDGGKWYYFLEPTHVNIKYISVKYGLLGAMQIGWLRDDDKIYYFNKNGVMQTEWVQDNGKWYYFNQDGSMVTDTIIDGYKIGSDGEWLQK